MSKTKASPGVPAEVGVEVSEETTIEDITSLLHVKCVGLSELMFNRFTSIEEAESMPPEDKLYLDDERQLFLPSNNVIAFLGSRQKSCAAKFKGKKREPFCEGILANVTIDPMEIPITREGERIKFSKFIADKDEEAGIYVAHHKALVKKGSSYIPLPTHRPVIKLPWEVEFDVMLLENDDGITVNLLSSWIIKGGLSVAFGSYRPAYGRFLAKVTQVR